MKATELIKPEELRSGIYLKMIDLEAWHTDWPTPNQIVKVDLELISDIATSNNGLNLSYFEPIELTEELLLRFGMVKVIGWDDMVFWRLEADKDKSDCFELMESIQGYLTPSDKLCKYAHTLQNCYYFHEISGKELTLN